MSTPIVIPIPVHPDDRCLPISEINLALPSGALASLCIPVQGEKTIDNAIATLHIWKPTLVTVPAPLYEI